MKKANPILLLLISTYLFSTALSSCKNDDPVSKPGSLSFHMHTLVDSTELEGYGGLLELASGRRISVTTAQLYISNVKLIKTDGSVIDGPSSIIFMRQGVEEYELGDIPSGKYKSVRFDVGLSNTINASTPSASDLNLFQPSMWFGPTTQPDGFVFVNFQGSIDTTSDATGTELIPFAYKVGTNAHRVTITMPDQSFTVVPEQQTVVHLNVNYAKLLDGIQFNVNENLHLTTVLQNSWAWVGQMETKIGEMFEYEE